MSVRLAEFQRQYVANFPTELPKKAAQGFVLAAVINLIAGGTISMALVGGTISIVASVIEAIARPIIRSIFPRDEAYMGTLASSMIWTFTAVPLKPWSIILDGPLGLPAAIVGWVVYAVLNQNFYDKNEALAAFI